jgi:hypothetical protein
MVQVCHYLSKGSKFKVAHYPVFELSPSGELRIVNDPADVIPHQDLFACPREKM